MENQKGLFTVDKYIENYFLKKKKYSKNVKIKKFVFGASLILTGCLLGG